MATTLTDQGQITVKADVYASFPIEKMETNNDGDLEIFGKASDPSVDHDEQIVDPVWMATAIKEWLTSGPNLRVQHSPMRDPAGIGLEANTDANGNTWVKSLVIEPVAKRLVAKGALRAYSVGIARPVITRDSVAKGGRITGGMLMEISLVDRPANKNCGIQLVKSADDGAPEYVGEVFGSDEAIRKALGGEIMEKSAVEKHDVSAFDPEDIISFTPKDLSDLLKNKIIKQHYAELANDAVEKHDFDRNVGGGVDRDALSDGDFAGRGRSFPIVTQSDVSDALQSVGRAGSDNYDAATLRSRIVAIARRKGFSVPDEGKTVDAEELKEAQPDVVKDPVKNPRKLDADGDYDGDGDTDDDTGKAAKPKKKGKKPLPPWLNKPADSEKGYTDPKTASGAEEPADMQSAPLGELVESPAKPHMKGLTESAYMRFKTIGIDTDMGVLHDMSCPAFHPEEVAKFYPYADFTTLIDESLWQRKALAAATGKSLSDAMEAQQVWQAVILLKSSDQGLLNDFRVEAYKAFRDANPGPTSFPTPGSISAQRFNRPCITDGHALHGSGYGSPNSSAQVATSAPDAHGFSRPPLGAGHQSPSPSHMKSSFEYPVAGEGPTRIQYAEVEKEKARRALSMLHDHMNHMFPSVCPMLDQDAYRVEQAPQHPPTAVGKSETRVLDDVYKDIRKLQKKVERGELTEEEARTRLSRKTAERYARDLTKQVQDGITSIDEVRKALGLPGTEVPKPVQYPSATVTPDQTAALQAALEKVAAEAGYAGKIVVLPPGKVEEPVLKGVVPEVGKSLTPDVMKTMMSEILEPFQVKIDAQEKELNEYRQQSEAQAKEIADHNQRLSEDSQRWEALANQPDPATVAFAGLALNPFRRPAGVVEKADTSEQVQGMMMRQLERTWRTSEHPAEREAAYNALQRMKGMQE